MKDIYALLGVSWQTIYKWRDSATVTQSRDCIKHSFIKRAGELFSLSHAEIEELANKAGLSLYGEKARSGTEKFINADFIEHFNSLLSTYSSKNVNLCESALVSDRMFRYIKSGRYLKKEPILALLIVMGLTLEDIQIVLKKAGFILSRSMPNDIVVIWMLNNEPPNYKGAKRLYRINEVLDSLELPLLMTRCKED